MNPSMKRSRSSGAPQLEDAPELLHLIQSRLPAKEAARTSVLSKSWLHAWCSIPTLRFNVGIGKRMKLDDVERTLTGYLRDNIPIERFALKIDIEDQESASHAEKLIRAVATQSGLKEFSLSISLYGASFTLPDEIFSCENLSKIRVSVATRKQIHSVLITTSVVKCVSLQELILGDVCISEKALQDILWSCRLLVKIVLSGPCKGFKTIKVEDLPRLYELQVALDGAHLTDLEISDVPNLGVFSCDVVNLRFWRAPLPFHAYSLSLGSRVTRLMLAGMVTDNSCLEMIRSGFPCLESLNLWLSSWIMGSFQFKCASIKSLSLRSCPQSLIDVQVHAPNLLSFEFGGSTILPSLLFPVSSLNQLKLSLCLDCEFPIDADFFLKMRKTLSLSRNCNLKITIDKVPLDTDIDIGDLNARLMFPPATNVQELWFETDEDQGMWERSPFFDAFFQICHPRYVSALPDLRFVHNNHFCRLMLKEVLEKKALTETEYWPHYLKHVQLRPGPPKKWTSLTNSHRSLLDGSTPDVCLEFKLNWR